MATIDDYRWLCSPQAQSMWISLLSTSDMPHDALLRRLRGTLTAEQAAILMQQLTLQPFAKRKFANPERWFWTKVLLEQSSDEETASETARDFNATSEVMDVCCGGGADAVALARRGCDVRAVDACSIACELAKHNLNSNACRADVLEQSAEKLEVDGRAWIHIDPDRRPQGKRTVGLENTSPSTNVIRRLLNHSSGMSLKLAPGYRPEPSGLRPWANQQLLGEDRMPIPDCKRFLCKQGTVRQQRWYWGISRWPTNSIVVSVKLNEVSVDKAESFFAKWGNLREQSFREEAGWYHEWYPMESVHDAQMERSVVTQEVSEFVGDFDPAVRSAQLAPAFAIRHGYALCGFENGYLTANDAITHPLVRWFRVLENVPLDRKHLKTLSRQRPAREWELKSRGVDIDLDGIRKQLHTAPDGVPRLTILFLKLQGKHRALICQP
jgi:SAM-dependent methyltransferase